MSRLVRSLAAAFAVALFPAGLAGQADGIVTGQVVDRTTQRPIVGVQVIVSGTQRSAASDQQGQYTIRGIPPGSYEIRARRVGYAPGVERVTVTAGGTVTVNFALSESALQLQEVVVSAVTGQEERRVEMGTNVGNIKVDELDKGPITSMADVLQARVAGVSLQGVSGVTGGSQKIRIRGANSLSLSNEPLLFIDGVRVSNSKGGFDVGGQDYSRLNDINPDEIENIDILKGPAAAALYGSVANNGVVLITTRRGRAGAPLWRMYAEAGTMKDKNDYPLNYAALEPLTNDPSAPFYILNPAFGAVLNVTELFGPGADYQVCTNYEAAEGDCTQDILLSFDQFRDPRTTPFETGSRNKLGLNVSGGSEALTYFISADQERELGVLRPNDIERVSLRTNLNARIGTRANAAITVGYVRSDHVRLNADNSSLGPLSWAYLGSAQYVEGMESDTVEAPGTRRTSLTGFNPTDQRKVQTFQLVDRFIVGGNATFTPQSWLRLHGNAGLDYYGRYDQLTVDPKHELPLATSYLKGFRDASRASNYLWTTNGSAAAIFEPRAGVISTTTLGAAFERSLFENVECYGEGIPSGTTSCAATTSLFAVDEMYTDLKTVGGFGRQEFAFNDRVFLSASVRADNNSGLVRDVSGLAYYPAANASWVVSRESFFPSTPFLNQLRVRAGWGQAGQRPGYGDAETFFGSRVVQLRGEEVPALILTATGNPNLKVERTTEWEAGFDAGFFDNRISTEFTFFNRRSKDALVRRNLAPSSGLSASVFENLGSIKNWGTELGINANVIERDRIRLDARFTAGTLKNRIEDLGKDIAPISVNRGEQQHRQGFPTGAYFAFPFKYNDANNDGKLSLDEVSVDSSKFISDTVDLAYVGPVLPTNSQGLSLDLTLFRNLTISTLFERRAGNKQLNATEQFRCELLDALPWAGQCGALSDPNASLESQAAYVGYLKFGATPYGHIEDATFIKWRELSVRLGVPETVGERFRPLRGASVSVSGRNLRTWTDYTGMDPEINEGGGSTNFSQGEFLTQPPVRVFTLRLDLKL